MRTHELAAILRELSVALSHLPDTDLTSLPEILKDSSTYQGSLGPVEPTKRRPRRSATTEDIHGTLATLSKREILELLDKANVSVKVRTKDSAKEAARKISTHLTEYPTSAKKIRLALRKQHPTLISQPLSKALDTLLGNRDEVPVTGS